jgi:hypothetical protein
MIVATKNYSSCIESSQLSLKLSNPPKTTKMTTINSKLAEQIAYATEAIPANHRLQPAHNIVVSGPEEAFQHLQDWAFTQGCAYVVESKVDRRVRWDCIFHKKETRNTRRTAEEDRQRVGTFVRGTGCKAYYYVSLQKKQGDQWIFCWGKTTEHNHLFTPDPFSLIPHRSRRPGYLQAKQVAEVHRGVIGFKASSSILEKMGLEMTRMEWYNLLRKRSEGTLTHQEEARVILTYLSDQGCHVYVDEIYVIDNLGNKSDRVIQSILWFTPEQLRLNRRFASGFLLETDATFNKEKRRLLLHNLVGIDNCGKTYAAMQVFATNESARVFAKVEEVWDRAIFYDCPGPAVLAGDFAAGLAASVARSAARKKEAALKALELDARKGKERAVDSSVYGGVIEGLDSQDDVAAGPSTIEPYEPDEHIQIVDCILDVEDEIQLPNGLWMILQRCEKHAVDAIKANLIKKGYAKDARDNALDLIWNYVKALDLDALSDARTKLLDVLRPAEQHYLNSYYVPKESSFCRAYTSKLPNLGVHSTQRNEKQHNVTGGQRLTKHTPTSKAVEIITAEIQKLPKQYDDRVNPSRNSDPRLIDREFFKQCLRRVTHYCLDLAIAEYNRAKDLLDFLEREHRSHEFNPEIGCQTECPLPLRFGIPCQCWMAYFYEHNLPLPLPLFHPRWLIDGPPVLHEQWHMRIDNPNYDLSSLEVREERYAGDKFVNRGAQVILNAAAKLQSHHQTLPPEEAFAFADAVELLADRLKNKQQDQSLARAAIPL